MSFTRAQEIAANYQSPGPSGIGFAQYASTETVTPELWRNIEETERLAAEGVNLGMDDWAGDMKELRRLLYQDGHLPHFMVKPSDKRTNEYRRAELDKVDASGEYPAKVKFFSDSGDTKHLNITAVEFEQIKKILLDYRND
jgi:hypothetical protein